MRVAIIGAGGRVGSCTAYALQCAGIVSEIWLNDVAEGLVAGEALDLLHGGSLLNDQRIRAVSTEEAAQADMIVITAGLRRKPDESRLDLINRNVSLFLTILNNLLEPGVNPNACLLVVSNPVDILTQLAVTRTGLPPNRVIGLGTLLDTTRFGSLIAAQISAAASQVQALILGEHGDSMVPVWSAASYAGFALVKHPQLTSAVRNRLFDRTRASGAELIRLKGGAGWAVGTSVAALVHAIALDQRRLLPVSSLQTGAYQIRDVCLSVPTLVGRQGVIKHLELELWPKELQALKQSARTLKQTLVSSA